MARAAELRRGKSRLAPGAPLLRLTAMSRASGPLPRRARPAAAWGSPGRAAVGTAPRDTGFPPAVKRAVRQRAGDRCEACAVPLPAGYGNIQHRRARKMGGSRDPLASSIVNAALLCGTPFTGDHGLCESRDPHMHAMGFWLDWGEDPALTPVMLHGEFGGALVWLTPDGGYSTWRPDGEAA